MNEFHTPVLLDETIESLNVQEGKKYIDATLGGGGHTQYIIEKGGVVLGIDVDLVALNYVEQKIKLKAVRGNFRDIDTIAHSQGFSSVSGVLFDLGVSSYQMDEPLRGFSYRFEGELDMRLDQNLQVRARDLLNGLTRKELVELFTKLGEEPKTKTLVKKIMEFRKKKPIETTKELLDIVLSVNAGKSRVFQALRIAVNDELNALQEALPKAFTLLEDSGRMAVITFHSLEDRIVKDMFRSWEQEEKARIITKKPIAPGTEELEKNPRSRSAKLRVLEKIV